MEYSVVTLIQFAGLPDFAVSGALNHIDLCCGSAGARNRETKNSREQL